MPRTNGEGLRVASRLSEDCLLGQQLGVASLFHPKTESHNPRTLETNSGSAGK